MTGQASGLTRAPNSHSQGEEDSASPIAMAVALPEQRECLVDLLGRADQDPQAEAEAREEIIGLGALGILLVEAEMCRQRVWRLRT